MSQVAVNSRHSVRGDASNLPRAITGTYRSPYERNGRKDKRNDQCHQDCDRSNQDSERSTGSCQGTATWTPGSSSPVLSVADGTHGGGQFGSCDHRFRDRARTLINRQPAALVPDARLRLGVAPRYCADLASSPEGCPLSFQSSRVVGSAAVRSVASDKGASDDRNSGPRTTADEGAGTTRNAVMLYHVQAAMRPGVTLVAFQAALNPAHSWYRLSNSSWLICSPLEGAQVWLGRLAPYTDPGGWLFISRFDTGEYYGRMPTAFWTWLTEHTNDQP